MVIRKVFSFRCSLALLRLGVPETSAGVRQLLVEAVSDPARETKNPQGCEGREAAEAAGAKVV